MRSISSQVLRAFTITMLLALCTMRAWGQSYVIDNPPPPSIDPPSPWHSMANQPVVTYAFHTSWDGIAWTEEQKRSARAAINYLDIQLPNQTFAETDGTDVSLHWAGTDFFKDWRDSAHSEDGWNLTTPLAVTYKHGNGPWDQTKYPNNEIYFNSKYAFSFNLLGPPPDKFDFYTIFVHELIHRLACDNHASHPDEVMAATISPGERRTLKQSDLDILRNSGYTTVPSPMTPVPEPSALLIFVALSVNVMGFARRRRRSGDV